MRLRSLLVVLLACVHVADAQAAPAPALTSVIVVGRAAARASWTDAATEARAADGAALALVGVAREGKRVVYLVDAEVTPLVLGGKAVAARARRPWPDSVAVRWSKVEPDAWRKGPTPAANGADTPFYTNVVSGGPEHGKWLGYDTITYFETPLGDFARGAAARRHAADAHPSQREDDVHDGLGTMRYKAEVRVGDGAGARTLASPGAEAVDAYGVRDSVHRVSIRRDDTTLGWLTAYFLVPEVFGSAGPGKDHQTERFSGADCADVLVGARRAQGFRRVAYTNVLGLPAYARQVAALVELDADGAVVAGERPEGVRVGDLVRIDYAGQYAGLTARSWDHVAMVYQDRSDPAGPGHGAPDGKLDRFDLVVHMGHPRLLVEPLGEQLPARLDVLRWKD